MEKVKKNYDLAKIASAFQVEGDFKEGSPYGSGHINDTFQVVMQKGKGNVRYILQRINHNIFKNPVTLMENIQRVTKHITAKVKTRGGDLVKEAMQIVSAKDNKSYHQDAEGNYWRCYVFIEGASTHDILETNEQAYQAAKAFGQFARDLEDIGGVRLHETIPNFHHTPKRFEALEDAIAKDKVKRKATVEKDLEWVLSKKEFCKLIVEGISKGLIPERITHNDTKINNVMLDDKTGQCKAVIDLDTVMPGSALYDFGDLVRTSVSTAVEDEKDVSKINVRLERFEALVKGFLEGAGNCLTKTEIEYLPICGRIITFECGIRFLTDFLDGDNYFKVHRENHNLERARSQFQLVKKMEVLEKEMIAIVKKYLA
jgi:Ser/Thr protein kinase RdoA (MazF antagonist)